VSAITNGSVWLKTYPKAQYSGVSTNWKVSVVVLKMAMIDNNSMNMKKIPHSGQIENVQLGMSFFIIYVPLLTNTVSCQ